MIRLQRCCCCGPVERGCLILAVLGLVFGGIGLIGAVVTLNFSRIISLCISLAFSWMLFHGVRTRKPGFILAYSIMQMIGLVCLAIIVLLLFVVAVAFSAGFVDYMYEHPEIFGELPTDPDTKHSLEEIMPIMLWVMVVILAISFAVEVYLLLVVFSHYQNLKEELYGGNYNQGFVETGGDGAYGKGVMK